jgi:hypothetical protein
LSAGLILGCAEPQARVGPQAQPQAQPPRRDDTCSRQALGYDEPSPVGRSAAEFVAKFGNRRTARRLEPAPSSSPDLDPLAEVSVSFTHTGGPVRVTRCLPDLVTLVVPVRVLFVPSGSPEHSFEAKLLAMGPGHVTVQGRSPLFGEKTLVVINLDDDEVDVSLIDRPDVPSRWSSLCDVESSSLLHEYFPAIPGPLVTAGRGRTMTCFKESETSVGAQPAGNSQSLPFFLTSVDPRGCGEIARGNVASFRGEVTAGAGQTFMPQPAPAEIGVDADAGIVQLTFRAKLPPSDLVRSFHDCPRSPAGARLGYWLKLARSPEGVKLESEVFELMYSCEDVIVRCGYDASKAP